MEAVYATQLCNKHLKHHIVTNNQVPLILRRSIWHSCRLEKGLIHHHACHSAMDPLSSYD